MKRLVIIAILLFSMTGIALAKEHKDHKKVIIVKKETTVNNFNEYVNQDITNVTNVSSQDDSTKLAVKATLENVVYETPNTETRLDVSYIQDGDDFGTITGGDGKEEWVFGPTVKIKWNKMFWQKDK